MCFVSIHVVHPHSNIDTAIALKKSYFILSDRSDFHMINNLSIVVHTFARHMLTSLSVDEILLPRYVNLSSNFRGLLLKVEMAPCHLKHTNSLLFAFMQMQMPPAACSRLCSRDLAWAGVFARSNRSPCSLHLLEFLQDIVCFLLFFFFFSVKPFSFIRSINAWGI